jgi:hypothetical protein
VTPDWANQLRFSDLEKKHGLPSGLLSAVMHTESAGDPVAVSPKGAQGLFQFMPETAKSYNIDPNVPEQAADGAARMYSDLLKQYNGDLPKALAGYNWGSGNMQQYGFDNMPEETRNYIAKVQGKLPQQYAQADIGITSDVKPWEMNWGAPAAPNAGPAAPVAAQQPTQKPWEINWNANKPAEIDPTGKSEDELLNLGYYNAQRPRNPGAKMAPPMATGGPGGRALQWYEQPAPPEQAPPRTSQQGVGLGAQGVGRGIADTLGMPVDLATLGINAASGLGSMFTDEPLPTVKNPIGGSDSIANTVGKLYEKVGGHIVDPETMPMDEKLAYNANRFGAGAMAGGFGLARAAGREAVSALPSIKDAFLESYRQNPARAFAVDTAAGVGGGTGSAVAEQLAPDSPLAQLFGTIIGAGGGATTAGAVIGGKEGAKNILKSIYDIFVPEPALTKDPVTGMPVTKNVANEAAMIKQSRAVDPKQAAENITEGAKFYRENNLPTPPSSVLSKDVGAIGEGRAARVADPTPFLQRDQELRTAQSEKIREMVPPLPAENRRDAQQFAQTEAERLKSQAQGTVAETQANLRKTESTLDTAKQAEAQVVAPVAAQRGGESQASRALDEQINEGALQPRTKAKNEAFEAIDPKREIIRDTTPITKVAQEIKDRVGKLTPEASGIPPEFAQKLDTLAEEGKASLGDMLDARKYLNTAAERAQSQGNFDLAKNIRALKQEINNEADRVIKEGGKGSKEALAAKKAYEEDYAPYFAEGFGRKYRDAVQKDPTGRTALPPSKTADFFLRNSEEAAADLSRITSIAKNSVEAQTAVSNYMKSQAAQLVKADGTMEPALLRKWLDNNSATLDKFPRIKQDFEGFYKDVLNKRQTTNSLQTEVRSLADRLKAAERGVKETDRRINDSVLKTLIDNDPENAAAKILGDSDPEIRMEETLSRLGNNKDAKKAFKRAVADHLEAKFTGSRTEGTGDESFSIMQSKVESYLKKPGVQSALNELYRDDKNAMSNLRIAQRIGRDMAKANIQVNAGSPTAELAARREKFLAPVELVFKSFFGNLEGGGQMRRLKLAMKTIPGLDNTGAIQRLLIRAEFEPELAVHLYGRDTSKMPAKLWTQRLAQMAGLAAAGRESGEEDTTDSSD